MQNGEHKEVVRVYIKEGAERYFEGTPENRSMCIQDFDPTRRFCSIVADTDEPCQRMNSGIWSTETGKQIWKPEGAMILFWNKDSSEICSLINDRERAMLFGRYSWPDRSPVTTIKLPIEPDEEAVCLSADYDAETQVLAFCLGFPVYVHTLEVVGFSPSGVEVKKHYSETSPIDVDCEGPAIAPRSGVVVHLTCSLPHGTASASMLLTPAITSFAYSAGARYLSRECGRTWL